MQHAWACYASFRLSHCSAPSISSLPVRAQHFRHVPQLRTPPCPGGPHLEGRRRMHDVAMRLDCSRIDRSVHGEEFFPAFFSRQTGCSLPLNRLEIETLKGKHLRKSGRCNCTCWVLALPTCAHAPAALGHQPLVRCSIGAASFGWPYGDQFKYATGAAAVLPRDRPLKGQPPQPQASGHLTLGYHQLTNSWELRISTRIRCCV